MKKTKPSELESVENFEPESLFRRIQSKLAVLALENEQKEELSKRITEGYRSGNTYWMELILSTVIAALGLLQNSVAVVIGAMLISPLFQPIQIIAFGVATGQSGKVIRGLKILFSSAILAITLAYLVALIIPLKTETAEILARTAPNLLDLFVALASAVVVFLALSSSRFSQSIAGVAMAAALIPPLAVVGIEVSLNNPTPAFNSLFLFITNLVAIILVGVVFFYLYGFSPHQKEKALSAVKDIAILSLMAIFITIPLVASLQRISTQISIHDNAQKVIQETLQNNLPEATLANLDLVSFNNQLVKILATIKLPEGANIFLDTKDALAENISQIVNRSVDLQIEIINTASVVSSDKTLELTVEEKITKQFREFMRAEMPNSTIIRLDVLEVGDSVELNPEATRQWAIKPVVTTTSELTLERQKKLLDLFQMQIPEHTVNVVWAFVPQVLPVDNTASLKPSQVHNDQLSLAWEDFLKRTLPSSFQVKDFSLSWEASNLNSDPDLFDTNGIQNYIVRFDIYLPQSDQSAFDEIQKQFKEFADQIFKKPSKISVRTFTFQNTEF